MKRVMASAKPGSPLRSVSTLLVVLAASFGLACATTQSPGRQLADTAIATKVKTKLAADPEVNPFKIDVDVNEGVVRLSGTVKEASARAEAEELALRTKGVLRVQNDIEIGERSIGERFDDAGITAKIKAKLTADPEINPFNINVDTEDGVVTLIGRVKTEYQKQEAEEIARQTKGVKTVNNQLKIGSQS